MKLIKTTIAKVTSIEYSEEQDCYYATIDKPIPGVIWTGSGFVQKDVYRVYFEFSKIPFHDINEGDEIIIKTYNKLKGDKINCFDREHTFICDGTVNVISSKH